MHHSSKDQNRYWRIGLLVAFLALGAVVVSRNWQQLKQSFSILGDTSPIWLLLGVAIYATTQLFGSISYLALSQKKVLWRELYLVEWASAGINRLLPAGLGSMGVHGMYLLKRKHSAAQTTVIVGLNNSLGSITHLCLLGLLIVFRPDVALGISLHVSKNAVYVSLIIVILVVLLFCFRTVRAKALSFGRQFVQSVTSYKKQPHKIFMAVLMSLGITMTNVLILSVAVHAVGVDMGLLTVFLVHTTGVAFGMLAPTPGGLGGVEAGVAAALIASGVAAPTAMAAALLFRFVTFWVPLVLGNGTFLLARRQKLI